MSEHLTAEDQAQLDILLGRPSESFQSKLTTMWKMKSQVWADWCRAYQDEIYRLGYVFEVRSVEEGHFEIVRFRKAAVCVDA
ncbi:hypothetical protein [Rhizobium ruizarguesonis]|uniref:hypothetical protein n=1 Tax=Rhizobium ruizarguesonis TaxID=2081791 RepID=UPI001030402B|nr:hypothetical protein [Rhizobium ruizarguesonis]MBY5873736.1 hypothetical protein [Rhizobium leguminosarum]TBA24738.1 hypothetical protein ELH61_02500 [Rhizobium ruizarguesonis]